MLLSWNSTDSFSLNNLCSAVHLLASFDECGVDCKYAGKSIKTCGTEVDFNLFTCRLHGLFGFACGVCVLTHCHVVVFIEVQRIHMVIFCWFKSTMLSVLVDNFPFWMLFNHNRRSLLLLGNLNIEIDTTGVQLLEEVGCCFLAPISAYLEWHFGTQHLYPILSTARR